MKFYFFDLDGTIEDSRDDMAIAVNKVREKLGLKLRDLNILKNYVNKGMNELYLNCFDDYFSSGSDFNSLYSEVKEIYEKCYLEDICIHTKCYNGIKEVLENLSSESKVFVVTNKPEVHSKELLKKLNLYQYITDIMGGDSCAEMKPSSLPLKILAKRYDFSQSSDKAYMIGDSINDIKSGNDFGAISVWCSWGYLSTNPDSDFSYITAKLPSDLLSLN